MGVNSRDFVSVAEHPLAVPFWLVVIEVSFEVAAVRILPLPGDHLPLQELAYELLTRFCENVRSFSVLLAIRPVSRVNVSIFIGHHALAVAFTILPVAVVISDAFVVLFADS